MVRTFARGPLRIEPLQQLELEGHPVATRVATAASTMLRDARRDVAHQPVEKFVRVARRPPVQFATAFGDDVVVGAAHDLHMGRTLVRGPGLQTVVGRVARPVRQEPGEQRVVLRLQRFEGFGRHAWGQRFDRGCAQVRSGTPVGCPSGRRSMISCPAPRVSIPPPPDPYAKNRRLRARRQASASEFALTPAPLPAAAHAAHRRSSA